MSENLPTKPSFSSVCKRKKMSADELCRHIIDGTIPAYVGCLIIPINVNENTRENLASEEKERGLKIPSCTTYMGHPHMYKKGEIITLSNVLLDFNKFKIHTESIQKNNSIKFIMRIEDKTLCELIKDYGDADFIGNTPLKVANKKIGDEYFFEINGAQYAFKSIYNSENYVEYIFNEETIFFKIKDLEVFSTKKPLKQKIT